MKELIFISAAEFQMLSESNLGLGALLPINRSKQLTQSFLYNIFNWRNEATLAIIRDRYGIPTTWGATEEGTVACSGDKPIEVMRLHLRATAVSPELFIINEHTPDALEDNMNNTMLQHNNVLSILTGMLGVMNWNDLVQTRAYEIALQTS